MVIAAGLYGLLYRNFIIRSGPSAVEPLPRTAVVVTGDDRRIRFALERMANGQFDKLLVVGAGPDGAQFAQRFGLSGVLAQAYDQGRIVVLTRSTSTLENAMELRCWLADHTVEPNFTLITSGHHMARTELAFRRALGPSHRVVSLNSAPMTHVRPGHAHDREWRRFLASWLITLAPQSFWGKGGIEPCP